MGKARAGLISLGLALPAIFAAAWVAGQSGSADPSSLSPSDTSLSATDADALLLYESYLSMSVACEADIVADYEGRQAWYMSLLLPDASAVLTQGGGIMPVTDWSAFTKDFVGGLVPVERDGITYWPVWVMEDATAEPRHRVIINAQNEVIAELPVPKHYDPAWWVKQHYPQLYDKAIENAAIEEREQLELFFDGSRLVVRYDLIDAENLIKLASDQVGAAAPPTEKEGGGVMMLWQGGSVTNLEFVDILPSDTNSTASVMLAYPGDFTNRIGIVACTNLLDPDWTLIITTNPSASTNTITYVDGNSTNIDIRFYHAYDADLDTDGDGVVDGVERFLDGTDPDNPNDPPNVKGTISYTGGQTGPIFVIAVTNSTSWATNSSAVLSGPGSYIIPKLASGTYHIKAWRDSNTNNLADTNTEAWAAYGGNPLTVTGSVTNVNFTITDPDYDADGLPDW
ncbi:MAG: hypothetical protein AAB403_08455, partial [Planctomycetota bacterium]